MDEARFQEEMFNLAAFMVTSARGLYDEPADYGPFRLVDTAGRLLAALEAVEMLQDPFLAGLKVQLDEVREGSMDDERQKQAIQDMVDSIAAEMGKRLAD